MKRHRVRVLDARGKELSPCAVGRAQQLVANGRAQWVPGEPPTIQLPYEVALPPKPQRGGPTVVPGTRLLLHICCGPCATYPVRRLRELGFDVLGHWYNPNIQPAAEYAGREESARAFARLAGLPLAVGRYEPDRFEEAVRGHEQRPERCRHCYRLRLEEAARAARERGIETMTTTLLISPYQDQAALREIGEEVAGRRGLRFFFENLRRGWSQRGRLAREHDLYLQQYCGCRFSLAERQRAALARVGAPDAEKEEG
jgi:predicted adenine nucleotide alpha hydrolase (AANH) superfamily ATPase